MPISQLSVNIILKPRVVHLGNFNSDIPPQVKVSVSKN